MESDIENLDESALFRSRPDYAAPETFIVNIKEMLDSGRFKLLQ